MNGETMIEEASPGAVVARRPAVLLLDVRGGAAVVPDKLASNVAVVDDVGSLVEHADFYLRLLDDEQVSSLVCLAVGEAADDDGLGGIVLRVPPALRNATVLWVGDQVGSEWAPDNGPPEPAAVAAPDALDRLLTALRVPEVFERVTQEASVLSGWAASPGIRFVTSSADPGELAEARARAVRSLIEPGPVVGPPEQVTAELMQLGAAREPVGAVLMPGSRVHRAQGQARAQIERTTELTRLLGSWEALVGPSRPTETLGIDVVRTGQAVENYRRCLHELLHAVDGQLQAGEPSVQQVVDLGVAPPAEARRDEIASELRNLVARRLSDHLPLPTLAAELRRTAALVGPQGCTGPVQQVAAAGPLQLDMPAFRAWPLSPATTPIGVLAPLAVAYAAGPNVWGRVLGLVAALVWFAAGWLLLARRPDQDGEHGFGPAALPAVGVYAFPALVGAALGAFAAALIPLRLSVLQATVVIVIAFLVLVATAALSWSSAVARWRRLLALVHLREAAATMTTVTTDALAREWQPSLRRKAVADALGGAAAGLEEMTRTLNDDGDRLFAAPRRAPAEHDGAEMITAVPPELEGVVRADLVDVTRSALEPAWRAAGAGRREAAGVYAQMMHRRLDEYGRHVVDNGLMTVPPRATDTGPRDRLMARIWSGSPVALTVLRSGPDALMTQLCRVRQLGYLSRGGEASAIRFAPRLLQQVLERGGTHRRLADDGTITWTTSGELVGVLRLVPLRLEAVEEITGGGRP